MTTMALAARPSLSLRGRTLLALGAVYVVWSSTYLALRYVVEALPPMLASGLRFLCAAGVLFGLQRLRGEPWPRARSWAPAAVTGALLFTIGNGLVGLAETRVGSGVAATACATTPLWVAGLGALRGERPTRRELLGIALGLAGVALLGAGSDLRHAGLRGLLLLVSPLAWALGTVLARSERPASAMTFAAQQMLAGGVGLLAVGATLGERFTASAPAHAWWALGYLVLAGSVVGFTAYAFLVRYARPAVATSYAYVNPALAVVLGAALGGEALSASALGALGLIVSAVVVVALGRR
ncbi:MAG: drug/metabolite exporter YedA [Deltaproteobacteria bacterium]|nr:drug/metabolite exporter YedA [Deltaproteobacteria bacterium]